MSNVEDCTRTRVVIDGENYYLVTGDDFITCTVPRENKPENKALHDIVERHCLEITELGGTREEMVRALLSAIHKTLEGIKNEAIRKLRAAGV